jgi:hypothetical protein
MVSGCFDQRRSNGQQTGRHKMLASPRGVRRPSLQTGYGCKSILEYFVQTYNKGPLAAMRLSHGGYRRRTILTIIGLKSTTKVP